jgi:hypothetical protein
MTTGRLLRIGSSFVGLLAGNLALLVVSLGFWVRGRIDLPPNHGPYFGSDLVNMLSIIAVFAVFSVFGWVLIGIPAVLFLSSKRICSLPWAALVPCGAVLGPVSLTLIFLVMDGRYLSLREVIDDNLFFYPFAAVVSGVAFWVHCLLIRRHSAL